MGMLEDLVKIQKEYEQGEITYPDRAAFMVQRAALQPMFETMGDVISAASPIIDSAKWLASDLTPDPLEHLFLDSASYISRMNKKAYEQLPELWRRRISAGNDALAVTPVGRMFRLDPSMRGLHTSSGDVIIPNFYSPNDVRFSPTVERWLQEISPDKGEMTREGTLPPSKTQSSGGALRGQYWRDNELQNKIRKALGFGKWGVKGVGRMLQNLVDPKQRALYAEYGISPSFKYAMDNVERLIDEGKKLNSPELKSAVEVAHSQMQQMKNIRVQAEAKARKKDATDPFGLEASDPSSPAFFNPKETGDNWYYETGAKGANQRGINLSESNYVQNYFKETWLPDVDMNDVRVVVKRPRSMVTGDHFSDVIANNKQLKHALGVFEGWKSKTKFGPRREGPEFSSLDDLEQALINKQNTLIPVTGKETKKGTDKGKAQAFTVIGKRDGGVWIKMAKAGKAKVEGGVNMLIKIEPNGNITGYMSDLHDFLEKTPVLGRTLDAALPKKVLAVSPPMQSNVYSIRSVDVTKKKFDEKGAEGVSKRKPHAPYPENQFQNALDRLYEAQKLQPSKAEIGRQALQSAGNLSLFGNVMGNRTPMPSELEQLIRNTLGQASYKDMMVSP